MTFFDFIYYLKAFQKFPEEGGSVPGQAIDG
jgi:hypothetical protein